MSHVAQNSAPRIWNVPNQLSVARIVLAIVLFLLMGLGWYITSLVVFIVAAATDALDGYWARKYGQITQLGRILDPFADKLVICGAFIFLAAVPLSEVTAWMAVVVVGRELLVTALRSFIEERGGDFSAKAAGKWKMILQCGAVISALVQLSYLNESLSEWEQVPPKWITVTTIAFAWSAVLLTIYSGVEYILAAIRMARDLDK